MPGRIERRPQAISDAEECAVYLGHAGDELAYRFLDALEQSLALLGEFPLAGEALDLSPSSPREVRRWQVAKPFGAYLVYYTAIEGGIEVLRILHGARDVRSILHRMDDD